MLCRRRLSVALAAVPRRAFARRPQPPPGEADADRKRDFSEYERVRNRQAESAPLLFSSLLLSASHELAARAAQPILVTRKGLDLLRDPVRYARARARGSAAAACTDRASAQITNKGTGFEWHERDQLGLRGLLPPVVRSMDKQVTRITSKLDAADDDIQVSNVACAPALLPLLIAFCVASSEFRRRLTGARPAFVKSACRTPRACSHTHARSAT